MHATSRKVVPSADILTHLYFSTVTFTTLGYGDYVPSSPTSQIFAGIEVLLGVFHIGLLAGIIFYAANVRQNSKK